MDLNEYNRFIMKRGLFILISLFILGTFLSGYLAWRDSGRATINLEWTTASEIDTIGFYIYRSENPDQGYVRVNLEVIPSAQDSLTGSEYSYIDTEVTPGVVYYYQLENVNMDGKAARSSPIEVEARSNYWSYLLLFFFFAGLATLLIVNRNWFKTFIIKHSHSHQ
jgi:hypothetical protein